jgi:hypothetical protein
MSASTKARIDAKANRVLGRSGGRVAAGGLRTALNEASGRKGGK